MSNYWKAPTATINAIREQAMLDLGYPSGHADEPFSVDGDFSVDGVAYVACQCPANYADEFPELTSISLEEYVDAQPESEEEE